MPEPATIIPDDPVAEAVTDLESPKPEDNGPFQHMVDWCIEKYELFKGSAYRKKKLDEAETSRQVYEQESKSLSEPWEGAANVVLPLTAISVDNLEPRLVAGLVGTKPYVRLESEGRQQLSPEEGALQEWWNNELEDIVKIEDVARDIVHDFLLDGTVFCMPRYDIKETTRRMMMGVDPQAMQASMGMIKEVAAQGIAFEALPPEIQGKLKAAGEYMQMAQSAVNGVMVDPQTGKARWEDQVVKLFEGGVVDFLKLSDVYLPDDVDDENYEDAPILRRVNLTYAGLMRDSADQNQQGWQVQNITPRLLGLQTQDETLSEESKSPAQATDEVSVSGKKTIECLECYVSYIYRKEGEREDEATNFDEERVVALIALDSKLILRLRLLRDINPMNFHIIRRVPIFRERGKTYGTSVYHKMKSIQDGASMSFNLAINTGNIKLLPWGFYDAKSGLDKLQGEKGQIQLGIGKMQKVTNVAGILFPQMNGDPAGFMGFVETWMAFWERMFNIGDLQVGRPKGDTATETLAVIQEGNVAHNYRSKRSKTEFLTIIQTLWDLYFAWMPLEKMIKIGGKDSPLPRRLMARGYRLRLTATTESANKLIERRQNEDFANMTGVTKTPGLWNLVKVAEDLAKSYQKDNPEEYVNPGAAQVTAIAIQAPQLVPVMMAAAQQAMQVAQQIQQGGEERAKRGMAIEAKGQAPPAQGVAPGPPTGEPMAPKFSPSPSDVTKPVGA